MAEPRLEAKAKWRGIHAIKTRDRGKKGGACGVAKSCPVRRRFEADGFAALPRTQKAFASKRVPGVTVPLLDKFRECVAFTFLPNRLVHQPRTWLATIRARYATRD